MLSSLGTAGEVPAIGRRTGRWRVMNLTDPGPTAWGLAPTYEDGGE